MRLENYTQQEQIPPQEKPQSKEKEKKNGEKVRENSRETENAPEVNLPLVEDWEERIQQHRFELEQKEKERRKTSKEMGTSNTL